MSFIYDGRSNEMDKFLYLAPGVDKLEVELLQLNQTMSQSAWLLRIEGAFSLRPIIRFYMVLKCGTHDGFISDRNMVLCAALVSYMSITGLVILTQCFMPIHGYVKLNML